MASAEQRIALAEQLPDIPRYVEARWLLRVESSEVFGADNKDDKDDSRSLHFVIGNSEVGTISVIGRPPVEVIQQAVAADIGDSDVLAFAENLELVTKALPDWRAEKAVLHRLGENPPLPIVPDALVRFLESGEVEAFVDFPEELHEELLTAAKRVRIAATIVDEKPVAFCYAGAVTEGLWDISIDTLEAYRQRGYAALCVAFLIEHFNRQRRRPVWGALESNTASMRLAAKLGFVPVDELFVFERR